MDKNKLKELLNAIQLEDELVEAIHLHGKPKTLLEGESLITPGKRSTHIPLVLKGRLKVSRYDQDKGEVFLYYLESGETCAMSISCCLEDNNSLFSVTADTDSSLWMIPMEMLDTWLISYPNFRRFIFRSYRLRFDELLGAIDSMAFMKMDERLFKYLLDTKQSTGSYIITKTHEQIAAELNTSRVVISRLLKKLEGEDKIELHRNRIEIL